MTRTFWRVGAAGFVLRNLTTRRDCNGLDLINVMRVRRGERLNAATSCVRLILNHAAKGWADPRSRALRHWAAEAGNWRDELLQHVTPSMRAKIDIDVLWERALRQADLELAEDGKQDARDRIRQRLNHDACPISLDDVCRETGEFGDLVAKIAAVASPPPKRR